MKNSVLIVCGTRPEALKLVPLYFALKEKDISVLFCISSQHTYLLKQVLELFSIEPDYDFNIMQEGQSIAHINATVLLKCSALIQDVKPRLVIVQGDTTTALAAGQAAFYNHVPIVHVEAGLRTYDIHAPFPEEFNRQALSLITTYHCAPTKSAFENLIQEKHKKENILLSGNTIVDTLLAIKEKLDVHEISISSSLKEIINKSKQDNNVIILFTVHRRESFGNVITDIFKTLKDFAITHPDAIIFYPVHPNPAIQESLRFVNLQEVKNIVLLNPLRYEELVFLLDNASFVVSDSGGIQEEAVSLGKTVLVLREKTERIDGVEEGLAHLVGTAAQSIKNALHVAYTRCDRTETFQFRSIYGDGRASRKIVAWLSSRVFFYDNFNKHYVEL